MLITCSPSTFLVTIKKCSTIKQLHQVHAQAITSGLLAHHPTSILTNILFAFTPLTPSTCTLSPPITDPLTSYALSVFKAIPHPSTFSYNTLIRVHTLLSAPLSALHVFVEMRRLCLPLDFHSFPIVLKACAHLRALSASRSLHCQAFLFGFAANSFIVNSLVRVYSACGHLGEACRVFEESLCKDIVGFNTLIDGLVKSGDIVRARKLFEEMPARDAVSWGTLIAGCAQANHSKEAIQLFNHMISGDVRPDNIALVSAISACAQLGEIAEGEKIHDYIRQNKIPVDSFLCTGLVDLYMKCGCKDTAIKLFEASPEKNVCTWNALLLGLGMHGQARQALDCFSRMIQLGIKPDGASILGVLSACSHAGLVHEASKIFEEMESVYGVTRELKHYGCMADLLARAGLVKKAKDMIDKMPMRGDIFVWGGLLGGCRIHGDIKLAEKAAQKVMQLCPEDGGVYSVMANVYANAERWDNVVETRRSLSASGAKKSSGYSMIKLDGINHEFLSSDSLHPHMDNVYFALHMLEKHQHLA